MYTRIVANKYWLIEKEFSHIWPRNSTLMIQMFYQLLLLELMMKWFSTAVLNNKWMKFYVTNYRFFFENQTRKFKKMFKLQKMSRKKELNHFTSMWVMSIEFLFYGKLTSEQHCRIKSWEMNPKLWAFDSWIIPIEIFIWNLKSVVQIFLILKSSVQHAIFQIQIFHFTNCRSTMKNENDLFKIWKTQ